MESIGRYSAEVTPLNRQAKLFVAAVLAAELLALVLMWALARPVSALPGTHVAVPIATAPARVGSTP